MGYVTSKRSKAQHRTLFAASEGETTEGNDEAFVCVFHGGNAGQNE